MPVAAVPCYLGNDFNSASPGMRFGMYLSLWGIDSRSKEMLWSTFDFEYKERGRKREVRQVKCENKTSALSAAAKLNAYDKRVINSLLAKQSFCLSMLGLNVATFCMEGEVVSPFMTGLGNEHPLENGFAFLNPYGLPYLPGSGVKGVLRQAARELAGGEWGETFGWEENKRYTLRIGEDTLSLSNTDVLFGLESEERGKDHFRGVLSFWDVVPRISGDSLVVEVMTPHQQHYYQEGETPHESGQPNPIKFLTVPSGSQFTFFVTCDIGRMKPIAPDLAENSRWQELLLPAFEHAFEWCGFGAKTAVGYGAMRMKDAETIGATEPKARLEAMSPEEKLIEKLREVFEAEKATGRKDPAGELSHQRMKLLNQAQSWESSDMKRKAATLIQETVDWIEWPKRKREKRDKLIEELLK